MYTTAQSMIRLPKTSEAQAAQQIAICGGGDDLSDFFQGCTDPQCNANLLRLKGFVQGAIRRVFRLPAAMARGASTNNKPSRLGTTTQTKKMRVINASA